MTAWASWLASLQLAGVAVFVVAWVIAGAARRRSAATRRGIWALAIMLASTLPLARATLPAPAWAAPPYLAAGFVGLWVVGAVLLSLRWIGGLVHTRRLVAGATPIITGPWRESLDELGEAIELRSAPGFPGAPRRGRWIASPMIAGVSSPVILIPAELGVPSPAERRAILVHELAHLARADNLLLHLAVLVRAIYWITPLAWSALRRLRDEAEAAADDAVLTAGATPTSYASQLVASARAQLERAGRVAAGSLPGRIEAILDGSRRRAPIDDRRPAFAVARLLGAAVLLASLASACEARSDDRPLAGEVERRP